VITCATLLVGLRLLMGCARPEFEARPSAPPANAPEDVFDRARPMVTALQRGQIPGGLDPVIEALSLAGQDTSSARAPEASRVAGDLLALRYRVAQRPDDLRRASDLYLAAARDRRLPGACTALRARAASLADAQSPEAPGAREAFERACTSAPARAAPAPVEPPSGFISQVRRVVLDPGHGGSDPGAVGPTGLTEKSVTLDVTRRVADRLATGYGVQVILTRDADEYVPLEERAAHANDARVDLFVSIHCNSAPNREAHGVSVFVLDTLSERVAARVTAREGELVSDTPSATFEVARILTDLRFTGQGRRSVTLAESIQGSMLHDLRLLYPDVVDMGVHPAPFQVLVTARMPAVLVELSFISNALEEQRLRSDGYRDLLAASIARSIASYTP
jgi:N-acetylmuramoyl-L-alanine amidase